MSLAADDAGMPAILSSDPRSLPTLNGARGSLLATHSPAQLSSSTLRYPDGAGARLPLPAQSACWPTQPELANSGHDS